jgi:flagellar basal-body rod protein FlgB
MIDRLMQTLDFNGAALLLRSERGRVLASNLANADTPNYQARDFGFQQALQNATGLQQATAPVRMASTQPAHVVPTGLGSASPALQYRTPSQSSLDGNTVDLDVERAAFADNAVRYEASLRFLSGQIKTMTLAINGQ